MRGVRWIAGAKTASSAAAHTFLAKLLLTVLNFGTGVLVARTLEAHGRGVQAAISIWPFVLSGLFTFGIPSALRFRIPREPKKADEFLSTSLACVLILGVVAIGAGWIFIPFWLSKYDAGSINFARMMMFFTPAIIAMYCVGAFFEATGDFRQSNASGYLPALTTLATLATLAVTHTMTPYTSSLAYLVPTNVLFLWRVWTLRTHLRFPPLAFRKNAALLFGYGSKAFGIDVLSTLSLQVDQALVIRFLSASQLGIYTVALAVSRLLNIFSTSITAVLLPKAAALETRVALPLIFRAARITFAMTALGSLVMALLAPRIVSLFYGHDFRAAGALTQILFVEVCLNATINVLAQAFLSSGRPGTVTALQGVGLLATVPLMLVLIPHFGLKGAALALLGSTALRLCFISGCFPALLKVRPPSLILTRGDIAFTLSRLQRAREAAR